MTPVMQTKLGKSGNCLQACVASALGFSLVQVPEFSGRRWADELRAWFAGLGLRVITCSREREGIAIALGRGPRGLRHAVVWREGRMIHDPHPDRSGLLGRPDQYLYWERSHVLERSGLYVSNAARLSGDRSGAAT